MGIHTSSSSKDMDVSSFVFAFRFLLKKIKIKQGLNKIPLQWIPCNTFLRSFLPLDKYRT